MRIELKEITIRELSEGYQDNTLGGVIGFDGKLDIRPPFQREFVYKDRQRDAVIDTASKEFPLNVMYWSVRDDGTYEIIDGQQRTISLCQYVQGDFSVVIGGFKERRAFHNLQPDEQEKFLDYRLSIYLCGGTGSEKLEWFRTINIAGEQLTEQELRNAVYHGEWVTDAKKYFSRPNCPAQAIGADYVTGSAIRQDLLETAIKWCAKGDSVEQFMSDHQKHASAKPLWEYYESVITWAKKSFPKYRQEMRRVPWGILFNANASKPFNAGEVESLVFKLMLDEDVTNKAGIYSFVFDGKESHLNIRSFNDRQKREAYERQSGICPVCKNPFEITEMEADHITPWHSGGQTSPDNCQMLCKEDNRRKSGI